MLSFVEKKKTDAKKIQFLKRAKYVFQPALRYVQHPKTSQNTQHMDIFNTGIHFVARFFVKSCSHTKVGVQVGSNPT